MLECGIASKAEYGYSETGATIPFVALNKYYNYECMFIPREYLIVGICLQKVITIFQRRNG